jgi:hypothetical protein
VRGIVRIVGVFFGGGDGGRLFLCGIGVGGGCKRRYSKIRLRRRDIFVWYVTIRKVQQTFYVEFLTIFNTVVHALKTPTGIPTPQAVMQAAMDISPSAVHFYVGKGEGRVCP